MEGLYGFWRKLDISVSQFSKHMYDIPYPPIIHWDLRIECPFGYEGAPVFLWTTFSQEELGYLFCNGRHERQPDYQTPLAQAEEVRIENRLEERYGANQQQECDGNSDSILHVLVGENADLEDRGAF